jgi:hypothetical protein
LPLTVYDEARSVVGYPLLLSFSSDRYRRCPMSTTAGSDASTSGFNDIGRSLTTNPSVNWAPPISPKCSESANPIAPIAASDRSVPAMTSIGRCRRSHLTC